MAYLPTYAQLFSKDKPIADIGSETHIVRLVETPSTKTYTIYFTNRKYEQPISILIIDVGTRDSILSFIQNLKNVHAGHDFKGSNYEIIYGKSIVDKYQYFVYDAGRNGYFCLSAKQLQKLENLSKNLE